MYGVQVYVLQLDLRFDNIFHPPNKRNLVANIMMSTINSSNRDVGTGEPDWSRTFTNTKEVAFFITNMNDRITPEVRKFLESYSNIPPADVVKHVYKIREKAWAIRSYPCTGFALFLHPMLPLSPAYPTIVRRLRDEGASLFDAGCFIGHDLRRLVFDGCPPNNLVGCDIVNHWDIGFEFYQDRDRPFGKHVRYVDDDVLRPVTREPRRGEKPSPQDGGLKFVDFQGQMDITNAGLLLHFWDWNDQVHVCKNLVALSKGPGSIIVGCHIGSISKNKMEPHCKENPYGTIETYWHNPETWKLMWTQVCEETGTKWETKAELKSFEEVGWRTSDWWYIGDCARLLQFVVERLA